MRYFLVCGNWRRRSSPSIHIVTWEELRAQLDPRPAFADRDRMCSPPTSRYWWTFERSCKIELNNNKECKIFHSLLVVRARVWTMTQYENNENVPSLYRTKLHTIIPADSNTAGSARLLCGYFHFHCFLLFCVNISVVLIQNKESHYWQAKNVDVPEDIAASWPFEIHDRLCHFEHWLFWCLTFNLQLTKKSTIPWRKVFLDWLQLTTLPGPSLANRPPWTSIRRNSIVHFG